MIASFDIGKKNFSFYVEEFNLETLKNLQNIPKKDRYHPNGTCKDDFSKLLREIYSNGKKVLLKNVDITGDTDKKKYFDSDLCHNLTEMLDKYTEYWEKVDYIVIEQQMSFGVKTNTMALKLGQHCASYFMIRYGRTKKLIEFPSYHKTQIMGSEKIEKVTKAGKKSYKNIDKPARKKWAIETAYGILTERDDFDTIDEITVCKKKDDLSDVIVQTQAFKYLYFVDC
jgi:C-terminal processing protease CtpA/Prc